MVNAHISAIFSIGKVQKNSASELKRLLSYINTPISALKGLGRPVQHWDDLLVFHILSLLDFKSREQWEIFLSNSYYNNQINNSENDQSVIENNHDETNPVANLVLIPLHLAKY